MQHVARVCQRQLILVLLGRIANTRYVDAAYCYILSSEVFGRSIGLFVGLSQYLFHRRTRTAYVYNGCLAWYNVVLTPRIRSSVKYSQLRQSANICDVSNQPTRTLHVQEIAMTRDKKLYSSWLYCTLEWYVELTIRHTTPDISCTQLYSLTMTTKATFCQLPTTYCFHCQPCIVAIRYAYISRLSSLNLRQTKNATAWWLVRRWNKCVKPLPVVV